MSTNLLNPIDFSCLVEGMTPERVSLVMSVPTYQALLDRMGTIGSPEKIKPQEALNGIPISYDATKRLHEVLIKFQPPHTRPSVTVTLDL